MEMHQLEQFAAIAGSSSMREAAEKLYLSQSTLSYNLKKLERELGCRLFDRTRSGLRLTPYGDILLRHVDRITASVAELRTELEEERRRDAERIHIGCYSQLFSSFELPQIASELPDCSFEGVVGTPAELAEGLREGRLDILFAIDAPKGDGIRFRHLYWEQAFVSTPKNAPLAACDSVSLDGLRDLDFSIEGDLLGYSDWYREILAAAQADPARIAVSPFRDHLKVKDALPTCNFISSLIMEYVRVNEVRAVVPVDDEVARREIVVAYRKDACEKLAPLLAYLDENRERLLSGNTFIPYFLFPEESANLIMRA